MAMPRQPAHDQHWKNPWQILIMFNLFHQKQMPKSFPGTIQSPLLPLHTSGVPIYRPSDLQDSWGHGHQSYQHLSCICNIPTPQLQPAIIFGLLIITSLLLSTKSITQAEAGWHSLYLRELEQKYAWSHPPPEECIRHPAKSTTAVKATKMGLRKHGNMLNGQNQRQESEEARCNHPVTHLAVIYVCTLCHHFACGVTPATPLLRSWS